MFLNFVGPPRLNRERLSALFFFYWTTTEKLEFTDLSEVQQRFGSEEIRQGGPKRPPTIPERVKSDFDCEKHKDD